ncbi:hypothetical protein ScPMuIL_008849 [Solemya velum]
MSECPQKNETKFKQNRSCPFDALSAEEMAPLNSINATEEMAVKNLAVEDSPKNDGQVSVVSSSTLADEKDFDNQCGFGKCKPKALQTFNNPKALLFFLCWLSAVQGFVVNGINNANTSTIERRFQLPSSQVGIIISAYDISAAILGVIISYMGAGRRKSKWLAFGAAALAIGSFTMMTPHFSSGLYEWGQNVTYSCAGNSNSTSCNADSRLQSYLPVFIVGQLLHGVGGTILYTIGVTFIDDSVSSNNSPFYIGIMLTFASIGPALGYLFGGEMLKTYVDFDMVDTTSLDIDPDDPLWVGAWWVGFVFASMLFLVVVLPLALYGEELPSAKRVRLTRISQTHKQANSLDKVEAEATTHRSFRDLPAATMVLLRNAPFICLCLAGASDGIIMSGFSTFMPKFIQNQYGVSAGLASMLAGGVAVPGAAVGQLVGGYVCKRWSLKVKGMLRLVFVSSFLVLFFALCVWAICEETLIAGITVQYNDNFTANVPNLDASCNQGCDCSTKYYEPVCSDQNIQFFSPCHAGCLSTVGRETYHNCSCLSEVGSLHSTTTVTAGKCDSNCNLIYIFLPLMFFVTTFTFFPSPPALSVILRCIPDSQRTYALGIKWAIVRLLGTIPGPILFGAVFDNVCIVWGENCGGTASCWIYDNFGLSLSIFLMTVVAKLFSAVMFILALKFYVPPLSDSNNSNCSGPGRKLSTDTSSMVLTSERKSSLDRLSQEIDESAMVGIPKVMRL